MPVFLCQYALQGQVFIIANNSNTVINKDLALISFLASSQ
jgi:hypothetical protein